MRFFLNFPNTDRASESNNPLGSSAFPLQRLSRIPRNKNLTEANGAAPKSPRPSQQEIFVRQFSSEAILTNQITGVPASVTIAQAALESGWGKHAPGNNFFGIKGKGPAGTQWLKTKEFQGGKFVQIRASFRKYHDPLESFVDHAEVIAKNPNFKTAMTHTSSAEDFIRALQGKKIRYASDPHYVEKILSIIARYGLKKLDASVGTHPGFQPAKTQS